MPEPQPVESYGSLEKLALHLREILDDKKFILLYAYNGTGKTRLSMAFKETGRRGDERDTLGRYEFNLPEIFAAEAPAEEVGAL